MDRDRFSIGGLSHQCGVSIETIRYYERIGLLAKPMRSDGGRRLYDRRAVRCLGFIRRARGLGFTIGDIRTLLEVSTGDGRCADAHALTVRHLREVRAKIGDLKKLERTLAKTAECCGRDASPTCPIIDALHTPHAVPAP